MRWRKDGERAPAILLRGNYAEANFGDDAVVGGQRFWGGTFTGPSQTLPAAAYLIVDVSPQRYRSAK
ncbi:MAG: hypothetical protein ACLP7P_18135 [Rhodomicrobium sp.]